MILLDRTGLERFWSHVLAKLSDKVDKVEGKGLSANDYTTEEKEKLAEVESLIDNAISEASTNEVTEGSSALVTSGAVHAALNNVSADGFVPIEGGTMEGALIAHANVDISTAQMLNIKASTVDLIAGESTLPTGHIYLVYEV